MTAQTPSPSKAETRLFLAFCLITALMPILSVNLSRSFAFIPGISTTIIFAIHYFTAAQKPKFSRKTAILIATILALATISLLWTQYFDSSKDKLLKLLALLPPQILLFSLIASATKEHLSPLKKLLPIAFLIAITLLVFEILNAGFLHNILRGEDTSIITDPDEFNRGAVALSLYAFPVFALLSLRYNKWIAGSIAFLPIIAVALTSESQASLMCLLIGGIFLLLFPYRYKYAIPILKYTIIIAMFAAPFIITPIYENFAQNLQDIPILAKGYAGHRLEVWDYISRYALQDPILGHGIESTRNITDFESRSVFYNKSEILHPHNFTIQIWMELGLIGILCATTLVYAFFTILEKSFSTAQQKIILPATMATLIIASIAYGMWNGSWLGIMFHIAAVTLMVSILAHNEKEA